MLFEFLSIVVLCVVYCAYVQPFVGGLCAIRNYASPPRFPEDRAAARRRTKLSRCMQGGFTALSCLKAVLKALLPPQEATAQRDAA